MPSRHLWLFRQPCPPGLAAFRFVRRWPVLALIAVAFTIAAEAQTLAERPFLSVKIRNLDEFIDDGRHLAELGGQRGWGVGIEALTSALSAAEGGVSTGHGR